MADRESDKQGLGLPDSVMFEEVCVNEPDIILRASLSSYSLGVTRF